MDIINLSLDHSLFSQKHLGDSHQRFVAYAKGLDSFTVIVPTTGNHKKFIKDQITYLPADSATKLGAFFKLYQLLKSQLKTKPRAIIICNDPVLGFLAGLAKFRYKKAKIQVNSFGSRLNQLKWFFEKPHHPFLWLVSYFGLKLADSIRTDTQKDKQIIKSFVGGADSKYLVLPVPPSPEVQTKLLSFAKKTKFSNPPKLLAVGSLTKNKDFQTLIKAVGLIDSKIDFSLTIVGSGPEEKSLKTLVKSFSLDNKIKFIPNISYQELLSFYQNHDIFISSSTIEGLPRVLQEASLAGMPIITTNFNGASDLIKHKYSGQIVPIGEIQKLAKAINFYLDNSKIALDHGQNSRQFAKNYCNFENVVAELQTSWQELEPR